MFYRCDFVLHKAAMPNTERVIEDQSQACKIHAVDLFHFLRQLFG